MINLTEEQIIAITCEDGYVLLIAGPGSGKTTVLSEKVIYYINRGVFEYRIQAFTFTNKATYQMERRIKDKLGREHSVKISNFHSYTYQILLIRRFFLEQICKIYDVPQILLQLI